MDMRTFISNQVREALKHKWYKGEKIGHDPGQEAVSEWINEYAKQYRLEYEACLKTLLEETLKRSMPRVKEVCPCCDEEKLKKIAKVVIEEFTQVWFLEMTKPDHDPHVEEI